MNECQGDQALPICKWETNRSQNKNDQHQQDSCLPRTTQLNKTVQPTWAFEGRCRLFSNTTCSMCLYSMTLTSAVPCTKPQHMGEVCLQGSLVFFFPKHNQVVRHSGRNPEGKLLPRTLKRVPGQAGTHING